MDSIPDELLIAIFAILVERALTDDQPSKATATTTTGTNHSSTPATKQSTVSRATSWFKRTLRVSANNTTTTTSTSSSSTVEDDDKQQLRSRDVPASTRVITSASQRAEAAKRQLILLGLVCKDWLRVSCDESLWRPIIDSVPHADINTLLRDVTGIANAASNWRKFMCSVVSIAKRNRVRGRQHNGVVPYHLRTIDALCSSGRWIVSASNSPYEACVWEVAPLLARLRSQRRGMRHWLTLRGTFLFHHAITAVTIASDGLAAVGLYNGSVVLLDVIERGSGSKRCDSGSDSESTTRPARYLIEQTGVKVVHLAISYTNNQHLLLAGWATGQLCQWRIAPHHLQPSDTSAVPAPTTSTTPTTTPTPTPSLLQPPPLPPLRPVQDFGIVRTAPFDQPTLFEHDLRASSPFILASPLECSCNATTIDDWLDPSHREHHHSPWYSSSNDACTRGGNNDSGDSSSVMASSAVHRYKAALFECDSNPDTLACCVDRQNNEVVVWNVSDTSKSFNDGLRLGGYQSEIITLSVDYPWLVTGTLDGSSRVWDLVAIKHELRVSNAPDTTPSVHVFESALADLSLAPTNAGVPTAITANAGLTATGFHRGSVVVWALPNPLRAELLDDAPVPPIAILKPQSLAVRNVCITDDAELLISSTIDSSIRVCRIRTAERLYSIDIASGFPVQFVSPAFALVAATGPDLYLIDFAELPIDLPASAFPKPDGVDRLSLRWIDSTTSGTLDGSHSSYSSTSSDLTLSSIATIDDDLSGSSSNSSSSSCSDSSGSASDSEMPISADTTTIAHDHDSDDDLLLLPPASYTEHSLPKDHRYQVLPQPLASNMSTAASTTSSMAMMTTAVTTMATSLDSSSSSTSTSAESLPAPFTWSIEFINLIRSLMVDKQPRVPPCDHHHSSELSSIITEPAGCPFQNAGHFGAGGAGSSISLLNDDDDDEELDGATSSSSATNLVSVRTEFQSATGRVVYSVVVSASVVLLLVTLLLLGVFLYELIAEPYHGVGPLLFHTFTKAVYITSIVLQLTGVAVFSLFPCLAILMMVYFVLRLMWNRRRYRQRHELVVGHHARTFEI